MTTLATRATLDDLYRTEGKAELVRGRIVPMPSEHLPSRVAGDIFISLRAYAKETGQGVAYADGIGYTVSELPSGRESFSPDASYYTGPLPDNPMRFIEGAPMFAVEVRSENDYGDAAEADMTAKRADYFAAGTVVVWDVDPRNSTVSFMDRCNLLAAKNSWRPLCRGVFHPRSGPQTRLGPRCLFSTENAKVLNACTEMSSMTSTNHKRLPPKQLGAIQ